MKPDRRDGTDWDWLDKATDADIDFSDIPPLDADFFRNAVLRPPRIKKMVSIRLDEDVVEWYKEQGPGYQTRINAVLKACMVAARGASGNGAVPRNSGAITSTVTSAPSGRKAVVTSKATHPKHAKASGTTKAKIAPKSTRKALVKTARTSA